MNRREKILGGLDLANLSGIEIGALAWPLVNKSEGDIIYVDYTDTNSLREKYSRTGTVPIENIVEVDAIWGENTLQQAIGEHCKVDYILASHVIEHVPDMLTWLTELTSVLKPGGEIRLAIPDRRFTFDYLRNDTTMADVLCAFALRARVPQPRPILDFFLNCVDIDCVAAWNGEIDRSLLIPKNDVQRAMILVNESLAGKYHDVHGWVFTPKSMATLFSGLSTASMIDLECVIFHDTEVNQYEFFVHMKQNSDFLAVKRSWELVAHQATDRP